MHKKYQSAHAFYQNKVFMNWTLIYESWNSRIITSTQVEMALERIINAQPCAHEWLCTEKTQVLKKAHQSLVNFLLPRSS